MFWLGPKAKTITKLNPNHPHLVCLDSLDGQAWPSFWRHNSKWRPWNAPRSDQSSCKGVGELALQLANHGRSWGCSHCFLASLWEMPENEVKVIWNRYMFDGVSVKRRKKIVSHGSWVCGDEVLNSTLFIGWVVFKRYLLSQLWGAFRSIARLINLGSSHSSLFSNM